MLTIRQFRPTDTTIPEENAHHNQTRILNMNKGDIYSNTQVKKRFSENNLLPSINDFHAMDVSNDHDTRGTVYSALEDSRHYREASVDSDEENRSTSRICSTQRKLTSNNARAVTFSNTSGKKHRKTHEFLDLVSKCPHSTTVCYEKGQFFYVDAKRSAVLEIRFRASLDETEILLKQHKYTFIRIFAKDFLDSIPQYGITGDLFSKSDRKVTLKVFNSIFNPDLRKQLQGLDKELMSELNALSKKVSTLDMISNFMQFIVRLDPRDYLEKDKLKPQERITCYALSLIFKVGGIVLSEKLKKYDISQNLYVNQFRIMRLSFTELKMLFCTSLNEFYQSIRRSSIRETRKPRKIAMERPVGVFNAAQADERPEIPAIVNALQRPDVLDPAVNINHFANIEESNIQQTEITNLEEPHTEHHAGLYTQLPEIQNYETERQEVPINPILEQQEEAININHLDDIHNIQQVEIIDQTELHAELSEVQNYETERQQVPIIPIIEQQEENLDTADLTNMEVGDYNA